MTETPETPTAETPAETTKPLTSAAAKRAAATNPPATAKRAVTIPVAAAIAVAALVGGAGGAGATLWATSLDDDDSRPSNSSPSTITVNDPQNATATTAVAAKAAASVVTISVEADGKGGTGSGVVLNSDGYILTNAHVVTLDGSVAKPTVRVQTIDGRLLSAKIIGTDPIADLAVIKVDADNLTPATFADSSKLNVGDRAIAIGAPLGLAGTVTDGIVSALNRSIQVASSAAPKNGDEGDNQKDGETPFDFWQFDQNGNEAAPTQSSATISLAVIQTDAAINPGNSGGALLDSDGNVIGINVAIASAGSSGSGQSGSIGVGFAIPSNNAKRIADEIIANGSATHGLLGAAILDAAEDEKASDSGVVGASIQEITSGGAADKAGLKVGDVITAVDGIQVTGKTDLTAQVRALAAGTTTTVTYLRDGKLAEVDVTLGALEI